MFGPRARIIYTKWDQCTKIMVDGIDKYSHRSEIDTEAKRRETMNAGVFIINRKWYFVCQRTHRIRTRSSRPDSIDLLIDPVRSELHLLVTFRRDRGTRRWLPALTRRFQFLWYFLFKDFNSKRLWWLLLIPTKPQNFHFVKKITQIIVSYY